MSPDMSPLLKYEENEVYNKSFCFAKKTFQRIFGHPSTFHYVNLII